MKENLDVFDFAMVEWYVHMVEERKQKHDSSNGGAILETPENEIEGWIVAAKKLKED